MATSQLSDVLALDELCLEILLKLVAVDLDRAGQPYANVSPASLHRGVSRAARVCRALRDAAKRHEATLTRSLLGLPAVQPYRAPDSQPSAAVLRECLVLSRAWNDPGALQSKQSTFVEFEAYVRCVRVDFEARLLLVGLHDGQLHAARWQEGAAPGAAATRHGGAPNEPRIVFSQPAQAFGRHSAGQVLAVDVSVSAGLVVSGSGEPQYNQQPCPAASVQIWSLDARSSLHTLSDHQDSVNAVLLLSAPTAATEPPLEQRAGLHAISASSDRTVIVWEARTGKKARTLVGHRHAVTALCRQPGADGMVFSCSHDSTVRQWDWLSGTCVAIFTHHGLMSFHDDEPMRVRMTETLLPRFSALSFHGPTCSIAAGDLHGQVLLWQLKEDAGGATAATGPPSVIGVQEDEEAEFLEVASVQHDGDKCVYVKRSGKLIVAMRTRSMDSNTELLQYSTRWQFNRLRMYISSVTFDHRMLVCDGFDNRVAVLDMTGEKSESDR